MAEQNHVVKITADVSQFVSGMRKVQEQMTLTEKETADFGKAMERVASSSSSKAQRLGQQMQDVAEKYNRAMQQLAGFSNQVESANAKIEEHKNQLNKQTAAYNNTILKTQQIKHAYEEECLVLQKLRDTQTKGAVVQAKAITDQQNKVKQLKSEYDALLKTQEQQRAEMNSTKQALDNVTESQLQSAQKGMEQANSVADAATQMRDLTSEANSLPQTTVNMGKLATKALSLGKAFGSVLVAGAKKATSGIKTFVSKIVEASNKFSLIQHAIKGLSGVFESFGRMFKRIIKRRVIMAVLNEVKESIGNVARESNAFNESMSSMISAVKQFANQLAAMVAPLIQILAPIVTKVVSLLTKAAETVSQFTARLTGSDTYMKALPVAYDYAASLDSTSNNANKAAKATDKLKKSTDAYKRTIMSFDQLHTLNSENSDITSSSSDSTTGSSADEAYVNKFTNENIPDKIKSFVDKIRKAFTSGDWVKLGSTLAKGVNSGFAWVDSIIKWENCGEKITEIITGITTTFNSFVQNLDWQLMGKTIGDGINTIVNALLLFINGVDWYSLGSKLGEFARSIFETVDWNNVGALIIGRIQAVLYTLQGFVSTPGLFTAIGEAFKNGFAGMIDSLDPTAWGDTIAKLINGFFEVITVAFSDIEKFGELGTKLATNLNATIEGIDPEMIASGISNVVLSLLNLLLNFIETTDWNKLGKQLAEVIANINWNEVADKFFEALGAAFGGLLEFIKGLIEKPWNDVVTWWSEKVFKDGKFSIEEFLAGIGKALYSIGEWIEQHVVKPFMDGLAKAFGFGDSSEMLQAGAKVIGDFLYGVGSFVNDIVTWVDDNICKPFMNAVESVFGFVGGVATGIKDVGLGIINGIKKGITDAVLTIGSWIKEHIIKPIKGAFSGISDAISNTLSGVESAIKAPFEAAWNFISPIIDAIKNFKIPDWVTNNPITNTIGSAANAVGDWASHIEFFANGGYPTSGDLFVANEDGPELVGTIGGRTAVAPENDIVEAVRGGVVTAINQTLPGLLRQVKSGSGDVYVILDDEAIANANSRGQRKINKRYSPYAVG